MKKAIKKKLKKISRKQKILAGIMAAILITVGVKGPSDRTIRAKVVMLKGKLGGGCSGEQIQAPSGNTYILTAAHCIGLADASGSITAVTEDGLTLERKVIAEDSKSDLMLLEGIPALPGMAIGSSLGDGEHVRTFTHGKLFPTHKSEGEIIGKTRVMFIKDMIQNKEQEAACRSQPKNDVLDTGIIGLVCVVSIVENASTAKSNPGSSGGPVVNSSGELVGVVSAGDRDGSFSYFVTLEDIHQFTDNY